VGGGHRGRLATERGRSAGANTENLFWDESRRQKKTHRDLNYDDNKKKNGGSTFFELRRHPNPTQTKRGST
jgi:hypothetical protein